MENFRPIIFYIDPKNFELKFGKGFSENDLAGDQLTFLRTWEKKCQKKKEVVDWMTGE